MNLKLECTGATTTGRRLAVGGWIVCLIVLFGIVRGVTAQEAVELTQRWEFQPPLNAFRREQPRQQHNIDMLRLTSAEEEYQLAEARSLLVTSLLVVEEQARGVVAVAMDTLRSKQASRDLRLVMASVVLKYSDGAELDELWELAVDDPSLRPAVEAGLVERKHLAPKAVWIQRLSEDPYSVATVDLNLAVRGLQPIASSSEAGEVLLRLLHDDRLDFSTRLAGARSLAGQTQGLEEQAARLLAGQLAGRELLASELLSQHDSAETEQLMRQLLTKDFRPAQVQAFRWLRIHRPQVALALVPDFIAHPDSSLRLEVVAALDQDTAPESLRMQGGLLADRNWSLRRTVRNNLIERWKVPEMQPVVDELLDQHLRDGAAFEGQEQAVLIVVAIEARERVGRLIELLDHERQEVAIRAAWGLQQLAREPGELAAIFEYCQRWTERLVRGDASLPVADTDVFRMAFLFQALGHNRYSQADAMFRLYVPKQGQKMRPNTRAAAIWALGEIWGGNLESGLEDELMERLMDIDSIDPEELPVQYAAAIALGKFGNPKSLPGLQVAPFKPTTPLGIASRWAAEQIEQAMATGL